MKKFGVSALAGMVLFLGQVTASNAVTFTITQPATASTDNSFYTAGFGPNSGGVLSDAGRFRAELTPAVPPGGQSNPFTDASTVSFGTTDQTVLGGVPSTDTYTNKSAAFSFDVNVLDNMTFNSFQVNGVINGSTSVSTTGSASNATFTAQSLFLNGALAPAVLVTSPNGRVSLALFAVNFGGTPVDVFVEQQNAITAPGAQNLLSEGGFVRVTESTVVPEPGSLALLAGMGVGGSVLLRRRRRA